jgi:sugar phosphate isomerase/epimerase
MNRRQFLSVTAPVAISALACRASAVADEARGPPDVKRAIPLADRICLFTDHLDDFGYSYAEVARMLKQLKVAGPDLTVRPGGLVAPERVADDLPNAVAAFGDAGLTVPMISTGLTSAREPTAAAILKTAGQLGIRYYKLGYFGYDDVARWQSRLDATRKDLASLLELSRRAGVVAGFHNHSGPTVGGALWDSWDLLSGLAPETIGFYFDPAQATIEGGNHAWKLGLARLAPRLVMVAIKDFVWEKTADGWRTRWVPLGQGMVRFGEFFAMLRKIPFEGPISLHIEYDPGGASKMARFDNSLAAAERDLKFLRQQLSESH